MRPALLSFLLILLFVPGCSSEQAFYLRSNGEATTDGSILFREFKTERFSGYWLLGRYDADLPGLFPVELQIHAREEIVFRPGQIHMAKGDVSVPALRPKDVWRSYRVRNYPLDFRLVLERPAFTLASLPDGIYERYREDTVSQEQRRQRYRSIAAGLDAAFTTTTVPRYETRIITLFFPLPVPDPYSPYRIIDRTGQLPSVTFYFERTYGLRPARDYKNDERVRKFLTERKRMLDRDLRDLLDEHEQLHEHEDLREKEPTG